MIGENLQNLVAELGEQKKATSAVQSKLQSSLFVLDQSTRRDGAAEDVALRRQLKGISEGLTATNESLQQATRYMTPASQRPSSAFQAPAGGRSGAQGGPSYR